MTPKKAFFVTFFFSLSLMMCAFGLLYLSINGTARTAGTPQQGVPITRPSIDDSKTILLETGSSEKFYFLFKFNRIQSKISIVSISPSYVMEKPHRTLRQSRQRAGIMQCVLDIKEEFGINIDYYISCSWDDAGKIIRNFEDIDIAQLLNPLPPVMENLLLKNAEKIDIRTLVSVLEKTEKYLDNEAGLALLNELAYMLVFSNGKELHYHTAAEFTDIYADIYTNINTEDLKKFEKILKFLDPDYTVYYRNIITAQDTQAHKKISEAILE